MVPAHRSVVPSGAVRAPDAGSLSLIPRDGSLISRACRTHHTKFSLQVIEPRNLREDGRGTEREKEREREGKTAAAASVP